MTDPNKGWKSDTDTDEGTDKPDQGHATTDQSQTWGQGSTPGGIAGGGYGTGDKTPSGSSVGMGGPTSTGGASSMGGANPGGAGQAEHDEDEETKSSGENVGAGSQANRG